MGACWLRDKQDGPQRHEVARVGPGHGFGLVCSFGFWVGPCLQELVQLLVLDGFVDFQLSLCSEGATGQVQILGFVV